MAQEFGVSTVVYNPLAGGLLTGKHQRERPIAGTRFDGNTMYLDEASDRAILTQLREGIARFRISFDYFRTSVIARTTGVAGMTRMADDFARMRAPWITGFDDVRAFAGGLNLGVVDDVTTGELAGVYRPLSAPPDFGPFYSICTLGSR